MDLSEMDRYDDELALPPRLEGIAEDDILESIKDSSHMLWNELVTAVREEDESEIGYLICQMVWAYKKQYGI